MHATKNNNVVKVQFTNIMLSEAKGWWGKDIIKTMKFLKLGISIVILTSHVNINPSQDFKKIVIE